MNILIIAFLIPVVILGAGVAISINTSMLNAAGQATQSWETEIEHQRELESKEIEINGKVYNSIDEYIQSAD